MKNTLTIFITFLVISTASAQITSKYAKGSFLLQNAEIYTITNGVFQGDLRISGDTITAVGENLPVDPADSIIDCTGLRIYPGLIDCGTGLGLYEIGSISLTKDANELGEFSPHLDALTAVNPNSEHIAITRVNGVTTTLSVPGSGLFPGQAALIHLIGYTPDQMYAGFKAPVLNFPVVPRLRGDRWDKRRKEIYKEDKKNLKEFWSEARAYSEKWLIPDSVAGQRAMETQYHALLPVFKKETPLLIDANYAEDIIAALEWIREEEIKAVLTGVREGWRVADSIAQAGVPVITGPVLRNTTRGFDRYDRPYANAGIMARAGVKVALQTKEDENVRNLPFHAGFAAAYGMGTEEALKAVTINPAEIFGLENEIGSLEAGKIANILVVDGDPFETKTQTKHLFIRGWKIPIESRQTRLYDEFLDRSPGLKMNE